MTLDSTLSTVAGSSGSKRDPADSRFRRNIFRLAGGSTVSQAIGLGAMPLLARLYAPEHFGALALFAAAYGLFANLSTLKYDLSIILPRRRERAVTLTTLTMVVAALFSAVFLALLSVGYAFFSLPSHAYALFLPLAVFVGAGYTCTQQWAARASDYRRYSVAQVMRSAANVVTSVLVAVIAGRWLGGLVAGFTAGLTAGLAFMVFFGRADRVRIRWPSAALLLSTGVEFKRFPFFVLPSTLLAVVGMNAAPFVLEAMFSLRDVGHYGVANRLLLAPVSLIGFALVEAFRAEFVDRQRRDVEIAPFFRRYLRKLVLIAVPIFATAFVVAPMLFSLALGAEYRPSGVLSRYLCLGVFSYFVSLSFHYVFVATDHTRLGLVVQALSAALPLLGLFLGGVQGDIESAVLFASLGTFIASTLLIALAYRCTKQSDRSMREAA